ncbi:helix-turn-helix transcriptional regulator [Lacisediminihabitans profunda]|uniref:Response regulator transcription factor n=1 Tax=Lacisediminihabitans profunda TaxID=2594790 RepID=A0A5C8UL16_9MICO|nr:response regulator transcription factor [Lacisediminihabitans profunda]TXN28998.1 response regulator transcription factor [Lacisediminihabitans profunda]
MDDASRDGSADRELEGASEADTRRSLRDMSALLALPALWVDHEPPEIATGLLSVLFGMLRLDGAYARFNDPGGGPPLETWRPSGPTAPPELVLALQTDPPPGSGMTTSVVEGRGAGLMRVTSLPLALPWETGLVLVSAERSSFPTGVETHLLRVAVSQGAIAVHTARRLVREHLARAAAEDVLLRQNEILRLLADDVEPSLASISRRVHEASHLVAEVDTTYNNRPRVRESVEPVELAGSTQPRAARATALPLTRREVEVLGLLAQGLSNREIAGLMWLSDRTVERHITSVYRKIGVARRSEATAFALRHGVVKLGPD